MQLSFGDAEYNGKRKRTRLEVFLTEMDQVVPWKGLLALIEPHYPKLGQPGRQPDKNGVDKNGVRLTFVFLRPVPVVMI